MCDAFKNKKKMKNWNKNKKLIKFTCVCVEEAWVWQNTVYIFTGKAMILLLENTKIGEKYIYIQCTLTSKYIVFLLATLNLFYTQKAH